MEEIFQEMLVDFNGIIHKIEFPNSSPYFATLDGTKYKTDTYDNEDGEKIYVINEDWIDPVDFENYMLLMAGNLTVDGNGRVLNPVSEKLLDYMGHINTLGYPNDYQNVKIHDNWIRDNFYSLRDPLTHLEDITHLINRERLEYMRKSINPGDYYIAGGAAMYLCNIIDDMRDVDIFTTKELNIKDVAVDIYRGHISKNCVELRGSIDSSSSSYQYALGSSSTIQVILRIYSSPSEIVHGFDLDSCGYCYDVGNDKLYRTTRAKYASIHKINYFDPDRSSPSYAIRLSKYFLRGFNIWMPYENRVQFNQEVYAKYIDDIIFNTDIMTPMLDREEQIEITKPFSIDEEDVEVLSNLNELFPHDSLSVVGFYVGYKSSGQDIITYIKSKAMSDNNTHINNIMPSDPVSIIFLMKNKNLLITSIDIDSDYMKYKDWMDVDDMYKVELEWDKLDPMKQLSGTFFPEPIETDILEWYQQSPLITLQ